MEGSHLHSDRRTFLASTIALGLAACGGAGKSGRTRLVLGDQVHVLEAKTRAAGLLDHLSYDIEWANFVGAAPLLEAINAGAIDAGPAGDIPTVLAAAAGAPLRIIAAFTSPARDIAILVPPASPIRSVAGLAGRRVVVSTARGSIAHYLLLQALKEAGVDKREVAISFMLPNDAAAAFAAGQVEAWATFGVYEMAAEARGARVLRDGRGINTGLSFIVAAQAALDDPAKRAALKDLLARFRTASQWAQAHPAAYAALFANATGADPRLAKLIVNRQNPILVAPDAAVIHSLQRVVDRFHADGELPVHVDVSRIVDPRIFPA